MSLAKIEVTYERKECKSPAVSGQVACKVTPANVYLGKGKSLIKAMHVNMLNIQPSHQPLASDVSTCGAM